MITPRPLCISRDGAIATCQNLAPELIRVGEPGTQCNDGDAGVAKLLSLQRTIGLDVSDSGYRAQLLLDAGVERCLEPAAFGRNRGDDQVAGQDEPVPLRLAEAAARRMTPSRTRVRLNAITAAVTPVRPGERARLSMATRPTRPATRGNDHCNTRLRPLMKGIARTITAIQSRLATRFPHADRAGDQLDSQRGERQHEQHGARDHQRAVRRGDRQPLAEVGSHQLERIETARLARGDQRGRHRSLRAPSAQYHAICPQVSVYDSTAKRVW